MLRRNKDRDERLKALQDEAAGLSAEAKRLEQQRAQLEAELAEAHRERCCRSETHQDSVLFALEGRASLHGFPPSEQSLTSIASPHQKI